MAFKPNMLKEVILLLDPANRLSKVSYENLKFFISDSNTSAMMGGLFGRSVDMEPSQHRGGSISEETSMEELSICRGAARKILSSC